MTWWTLTLSSHWQQLTLGFTPFSEDNPVKIGARPPWNKAITVRTRFNLPQTAVNPGRATLWTTRRAPAHATVMTLKRSLLVWARSHNLASNLCRGLLWIYFSLPCSKNMQLQQLDRNGGQNRGLLSCLWNRDSLALALRKASLSWRLVPVC